MWFKQLGLFLVLVLGVANSFAGPGGQRGELRGAAFHAQNAALERDERMQDQPMPPQGEPRRIREFGLPETSGYGGQSESGSNADYPRRQGRMSPEERRALRRQIDEVGHDIYSPRP